MISNRDRYDTPLHFVPKAVAQRAPACLSLLGTGSLLAPWLVSFIQLVLYC